MADKTHGGRNLFGTKIQESDEITNIAAVSTTLRSGQNYVIVDPGTEGNIIITLPAVGSAPWEWFYIISIEGDDTFTVVDATGTTAYTSTALTAADDFVLVRNIGGLAYKEIVSNFT